ncbi:MAG: outer membrane beta-barrel domain-containing protein [Myxococcota bacterium]
MKKPRFVLALAVLTSLLVGQRAFAQDMSFDLDDTEEDEAGDGAATEDADEGGGDEGGGDVIGDLADEGEAGLDEGLKERERATETVEEIYAIQRIFALRLDRLEIAPSAAFNINDPFVSHPGIGIALNYWFTNVLAVGANFLWYQGLGNARDGGSDLNYHVQQAASLGVPVNEWQMGANLNFTYVPLYGKFSMFREFIFQWDAYVVGGVGMMRTRPIPVVDINRDFDFGTRVAFNAGLGIRVFVTRFLSIFGELRDYFFLEKFENREVDLVNPDDPDTWLQDGTDLTHNVSVQVGFTLFFPFTFEYKLPK